MNIVSMIVAYVGELERRWKFRRTEQMIGALPAEVQKDIGWPGAARGVDEARVNQTRAAAC